MTFESALNNVIDFEGGYVNDPDDKGGETYKGISRHYHPNWPGWEIIDRLKQKYSHLSAGELRNNKMIQKYVEEFYLNNYWDKFRGNDLPAIIAEELFEQSVNLGTWKTAGENLQRALNLLNRNGLLFKDLKVDGLVGSKTLYAINRVNHRRLLKVLNGLQFMEYYKIDIKNPTNEKFVGWFDRT